MPRLFFPSFDLARHRLDAVLSFVRAGPAFILSAWLADLCCCHYFSWVPSGSGEVVAAVLVFMLIVCGIVAPEVGSPSAPSIVDGISGALKSLDQRRLASWATGQPVVLW